MSRYTHVRDRVPLLLRNTSAWLDVSTDSMDDAQIHRHRQLRELITDCLAGRPTQEKLKDYKIHRQELIRQIKRCITLAPDGQIFGWRALIPGLRIARYKRQAPTTRREGQPKGGFAGALTQLFDSYPAIQEEIDNTLSKRPNPATVHEAKIAYKTVHQLFLKLCSTVCLPPTAWPFCCFYKGSRAIATYCRRYFAENYDETVVDRHGEKAQAKSRVGRGHKTRVLAYRPFDLVSLDEHDAHFLGAVGIDTPQGVRWVPIGRVVIIAVIDRILKVLFGFVVVIARKVDADDVNEALEICFRKWEPRKFTIPGYRYREGAGFPSGSIEGWENCSFCLLLIDKALAHLANEVLQRVPRRTGAAINFGGSGKWERRHDVERAFLAMEEAGFERLPSTTGSGPSDPLRQNAEGKAVEFRMHIQGVFDLIYKALGDSNAIPSGAAYGIGRLDAMRAYIADPVAPLLRQKLPELLPHEPALDVKAVTVTIRGSEAKGRAPHVNYMYGEYTSISLGDDWSLIGESIVVHVRSDLRTLTAFHHDGRPLGELKVTGPWGALAFTADDRREIRKLLIEGTLKLDYDEDAMVGYLRYLRALALKEAGKRRPKVTDAATRIAAIEIANGIPSAVDGNIQAQLKRTARPQVRDSASVILARSNRNFRTRALNR